MSELAERCIASWQKYMPEWEYRRWDETNFDIAAAPLYVRQAYEAKKFAFVSDYVRLWALEQYGGLYMDVDFEVYRPFDELMDKYAAFAGYEGSKRKPVMQGVIASEAHGAWVRDMLETYKVRKFIRVDNSLDLTPNTSYFSDRLENQGAILDGKEKDIFVNDEPQVLNEPHLQRSMSRDKSLNDKVFYLHVYPVHYFCPQLTTGENVRNEETYCEHKGESSWAERGWKAKILCFVGPTVKAKLIKLKRRIFG